MEVKRGQVVHLRVRDSLGTTHPITADFNADATVDDLKLALSAKLGDDSDDISLSDSTLRAGVPEGARLIGVQLYHGQQLALDNSSDVLYDLPELVKSDLFRIVHESGFQLGFAWPVPPFAFLHYLSIDEELGVVRPVDNPSLADFSLAVAPQEGLESGLDDSPQELRVRVHSKRTSISINGRPQDEAVITTPGALVQITYDSQQPTIDLRVMTAAEHDLLRLSNGTINYRARPSSVEEERVEPLKATWKAPTPPTPPEWDWTDVLLQEGSMLLLVLFLAFGVASPYLIVVGVMPIFRVAYRLRKYHKDRAATVDKYHEAVHAFDRQLGILADQVQREAVAAGERSPKLEILSRSARRRDRELWQRHPDHESFLVTTIGSGVYKSPSTATISGADTDDHVTVWRGDVENVRLLADAPIEYNLASNDLAIIGPSSELHDYVADLVLRLAMQHSPGHLSIAAILPSDDQERASLSWMRWLPHTRTVSDLFAGPRFVVGGHAAKTALRLSSELAGDAPDNSDSSALLVIVHEASGADAGDLDRYRRATRGRAHVLWIGSASSRVPAAIGHWLELEPRPHGTVSGRTTAMLYPGGSTLICQLADLQYVDSVAADIACLVDESVSSVSQAMPQMVRLGSIAQVAADGQRWRSPQHELVAALGEDAVGPFELDLVEQGPHVLVAGTTGSGKSELLRSMVLSLATRYLPTDLAMIFIDFKGGASLGDLESLPHAVGMVTNLDSLDVERLVRFLQAEIERRQQILAPAPYNGEYRKHYEDNHGRLPRLLVVIDEFSGFSTLR